jgi:hypothetical protein
MGLHIGRCVLCTAVLCGCVYFIFRCAPAALGFRSLALYTSLCAALTERDTHKMAFSAWLWAVVLRWKWFSATGIPHCGHVSDANQPFVRIIITSAGRSRSLSLSRHFQHSRFSPLRRSSEYRRAHFCAGRAAIILICSRTMWASANTFGIAA